jgi:pSer/pThr/pTyr-binding forkhead associated (FHA) protein
MSHSALAVRPASATKWTIVSGPMKGAVRLMNMPSFVVGRSPECEFVIVNDPKCSRRHAQITSNGSSSEVISLNENNLIAINGNEVERGTLQDGDIVTFGDTKVQYQTTSASTGSHLVPVGTSAGAGTGAPMPVAGPSRSRPRGKPRRTAKTGSRRLIIYGVLGLVALWLFLPSKAKKAEKGLHSEQQIQQEIEEANKLRDAAEKQSLKRMDSSVMARQAQENYVRGFRDYQKGQYERALFSFQACLALNPDHVLCNRYLRLGQRKFDEVVQQEMVLGMKYRDQNQYKACRSSFRNVMVMVKDANSQVFQQAKANYEACDALVEGRF